MRAASAAFVHILPASGPGPGNGGRMSIVLASMAAQAQYRLPISIQ